MTKINRIRGFIFDLDGVLVDTAMYHEECWREMAQTYQIKVTPEVLEMTKGVSRMDALDIVLQDRAGDFPHEEKVRMASWKNDNYLKKIDKLTPDDLLPGVLKFLETCKRLGLKIGVGSSSKNAKKVLTNLKITHLFDAISDGTNIINSKPDPEVFTIAIERLNLNPGDCIVFEDAQDGIFAAKAAGCWVVGIDTRPVPILHSADLIIAGLNQSTPQNIIDKIQAKKVE